MTDEKKEKLILRLSFCSGLAFAIVEFVFAIFSHSQSALMDAVYDTSELVFIALLLFLTPLFHKPVSEKHPYGYLQVESLFVIIKSVMMLSVSMGVSAEVIESALTGGNPVNNIQISLFQCCLGVACLIIFLIMRKVGRNLTSPTIKAELMGWKLDILYSLGMALAFFASMFLEKTPLAFLAPYFDQIVAVVVMVFMLPESIKILWRTTKDLFLFSPDKKMIEEIKALCNPILEKANYNPIFYDITKTGRHLWIAIYFRIEASSLEVVEFSKVLELVNQKVQEQYSESTCELILNPQS